MVALAFLALAAGAVAMIAGITGSSIRSVAEGHPDHSNSSGPAGVSGSVQAGSATAPTQAGGSSAQKAKVAQISKARGWEAGAWEKIIELESGWDPTARNASSGAYGTGQALGATVQEYPKMVSADALVQLEGMAEYIAARYGNPSKALAFHLEHGWY